MAGCGNADESATLSTLGGGVVAGLRRFAGAAHAQRSQLIRHYAARLNQIHAARHMQPQAGQTAGECGGAAAGYRVGGRLRDEGGFFFQQVRFGVHRLGLGRGRLWARKVERRNEGVVIIGGFRRGLARLENREQAVIRFRRLREHLRGECAGGLRHGGFRGLFRWWGDVGAIGRYQRGGGHGAWQLLAGDGGLIAHSGG